MTATFATSCLSTREVVKATGATSRQLEHGRRNGWLWATKPVWGSGDPVDWSEAEMLVIARLVEVSRALPFTTFGALARNYAATLRNGFAVEIAGPWGIFAIEPVDAPR